MEFLSVSGFLSLSLLFSPADFVMASWAHSMLDRDVLFELLTLISQ